MTRAGFIEIDRRQLLAAGGAIVVSFALAAVPASAASAAPEPGRPLSPDRLDSYIAIGNDGRCTAFFGKIDVGQGLQVAIAQIVAEELDLPLDRVTVVLGDTARTVDQGGASGSYGISKGGQALRVAATEARRILLSRAATVLGVPADRIETVAGTAVAQGKTITYGELVGDSLFETTLDWNGKLGNRLEVTGVARPKDPKFYKLVGTSPPRDDLHDNVFGRQRYVTNIRLPGMLHARVIRPPRTGAVPVEVDAGSIASFGARLIHEGAIIAVLAELEWDAVKAADALKVRWSEPEPVFPEPLTLYDHLRTAPAEKVQVDVSEGDVDAAAATDETMLQQDYEWPFQSHASMVGACAVADVRDDGATVWSGTQKPHAARGGIAALLKLPPDSVRVIWTRGPGSYGRNDAGDAAFEAAFLSRAVGRPVRLQYTRAQGTGWDPKAPASVHQCKGIVGHDGKVKLYTFTSRGFSRLDVAPAEADPRDTLPGQLLGMGQNPQQAFAVPGEPYVVPAKRLAWETLPALASNASPLRTAHMRDPVGLQISFASESFWDEMAHAAGTDPVDFRLKHLEDPRALAVLRRAADLFGWTASRPGKGKGHGIALAARGDTVCAVATEIEVDSKTGHLRPVRYAIAHDCGLIINPDTLKRVIEGNLIQATSRSLLEEVSFDRHMVTSRDWISYPVANTSHLPDRIDIDLIDRPELPPGGAGEPASRPVPAALANALFNATGVRLRRAPLSPARVAAALA